MQKKEIKYVNKIKDIAVSLRRVTCLSPSFITLKYITVPYLPK